ncbi:hypothetical protein [Oceanospirillum sediminis]|uniref:Uncharacterized protein n=1 Tax=Oceanospirillum sediminis TaxID=2760088 RepID=A0A839IUM0_9GAMM|nr:hypothetical protein [Oceanospirillum sediminis]MBB1488648.1 hypothetical protein [Oceanospirillum sediminis]
MSETTESMVYANTPLNPKDEEHKRIIAWRDTGGSKNKSDTMRKLATGGGILQDAGLLDLVVSLEKMPGIDAKKALQMALASLMEIPVSSMEAPEPPVEVEEKRTTETERKTRPMVGKVR